VAHSNCAKWHIQNVLLHEVAQNVLLHEVAQNVLRMSSTPTPGGGAPPLKTSGIGNLLFVGLCWTSCNRL